MCIASTGALFLFSVGAAGASTYRRGPAPAWVRAVAVPSSEVPPDGEREDIQELLIDEQDRFAPDVKREQYRHYAYRLVTAAGVHDQSELTIRFDPGFQVLTLHSVNVLREGSPIDVLGTSQIRITNTQSDTDARVFDDELAVHVLVPGTRVGDIVEYSFTRRGQNPALRGGAATTATLARFHPVASLYKRVVYAGPGVPRFRVDREAPPPRETKDGGTLELLWAREAVPAVPFEDSLPGGYEPLPWFEFSDFATWQDVVRWALPLYAQPDTLTPEVEALVKDWMRSDVPEVRLVSAFRFVQDEIRYLGIEIGPNSLEPRPPGKVLHDRFGDCKDKALLLVTLLRRLGVTAFPVLVSSSASEVTTDTLPSPVVFDHVVVKVTIAERTFFLDPTVTHQRGDPQRLRADDFGLALVIAPNVTALERMAPDPSEGPQVDLLESYDVTKGNAPVTLRVVTQFVNTSAVAERRHFGTESIAEIQRKYENFYTKRFSSVRVAGQLAYQDSEETNTVSVTEQYELSAFWQDGKRTLDAWSIQQHLEKPSVVKRTMPLAVPHPLDVQHVLSIDGLGDADYDTSSADLRDGALHFTRTASKVGSQLRLVYRLRSLADRVRTDEIPNHLKLLDDIWSATSYELSGESGSQEPGPGSVGRAVASNGKAPGWTWLLAIGAAFGVLLISGAVATRRKRPWAHRPERGTTPSAPILARADEDAHDGFRAIACRCGAHPDADAVRSSTVRFDRQSLTVLEAVCEQCGHRTARYYAVSQ